MRGKQLLHNRSFSSLSLDERDVLNKLRSHSSDRRAESELCHFEERYLDQRVKIQQLQKRVLFSLVNLLDPARGEKTKKKSSRKRNSRILTLTPKTGKSENNIDQMHQPKIDQLVHPSKTSKSSEFVISDSCTSYRRQGHFEEQKVYLNENVRSPKAPEPVNKSLNPDFCTEIRINETLMYQHLLTTTTGYTEKAFRVPPNRHVMDRPQTFINEQDEGHTSFSTVTTSDGTTDNSIPDNSTRDTANETVLHARECKENKCCSNKYGEASKHCQAIHPSGLNNAEYLQQKQNKMKNTKSFGPGQGTHKRKKMTMKKNRTMPIPKTCMKPISEKFVGLVRELKWKF